MENVNMNTMAINEYEENTASSSLTQEAEESISQSSEGKINVLEYGCDNTGETDNSAKVQQLLDSYSNKNIYFPHGVYKFTEPIICKNNNTIIGDSNVKGTFDYAIVKEDSEGNKVDGRDIRNGTLLWYQPTADNTTFLTFEPLVAGCLKNINIGSNAGKFVSAGHDERPEIPYNPYSYTESVVATNGLLILTERVFVDNVTIQGFSGFGISVYLRNELNNIRITNCGKALVLTGTDAILNRVYITMCKNGIYSEGYAAAVVFCYNIWIDQIVEYGIKAAGLQGVVTGLIDHVGYAGICLNETKSLKLDLRIGRCGMYYAGAEKESIPQSYEELSKASFISIKTCEHGEFWLSLYKRSIADSNSTEYLLPTYVLNGVDMKAVIFGTYPNECDICTPIVSVDSDIVVYAYDGIHQYPDKSLKITAYVANKTSPQVSGTSIKTTVTAKGGIGTLQYQFSRTNVSTGEIKIYKEWSEACETYCDPGTGEYVLKAEVKDEEGTVVSAELPFTWTES